ncbi:MAG: branched-chain amino acid aminotransferase [Cyclobacteriaceae bacterium]|nr:branched-chain amino acid aminotransferase [Cyclobacteriaceae bacterium]
MVETESIAITRTKKSRLSKTNFTNLPFGKVFTDHMFMADYRDGQWKNLRIVPYGNIQISPATPALHYGQSIFEGMKAYRAADGKALVFRAADNWKRMNISAERMCMPALPEDLFMDALSTIIDLDRDWIPNQEGSSLYIRPFMFSADEFIGIRPSLDFTFMILLSPVGPYYSTPVKVKIETHYTRAVEGGTGFAKAGGNYGGAIYPAKLAQDEGYHQLVWTDGKTHEYVEESGTMNLMFVINNTLITPALSDSILAGITRQSVIDLARHWGMHVEERKISIIELVAALKQGRVQEAFGAGTAATIAHIELIGYEDEKFQLPPIENRTFSNRVLNELENIKRGKTPSPFDWMIKI